MTTASVLPAEPGSRAHDAKTVPQRIALIEDLMLRFQYVTRKTARDLAEVWGCSPNTVENYACEASRNIKRSFGSNDQDREAKILGYLAGIIHDCRERTEEVIDVHGNKHTVKRPDQRTALRAIETLVGVFGLRAPNKLEVIERVQKLSEDEITQQLRLHGYELRKLPEVVDTAGELSDGNTQSEAQEANEETAGTAPEEPAPMVRGGKGKATRTRRRSV